MECQSWHGLATAKGRNARRGSRWLTAMRTGTRTRPIASSLASDVLQFPFSSYLDADKVALMPPVPNNSFGGPSRI